MIGISLLTIGINGRILAFMSDTPEQAFLDRLWKLQDDAKLTDAQLAHEMGVNQSHIWRAKKDPSRTFGIKFARGAVRWRPELAFFLHPEMRIGHHDMPISSKDGEGAA